MMSRRRVLGLLAASVTPVLAARRAAAAAEPPILKMALASGQIPEMAQRLPKVPRVIDLAALNRKPGRYGGAVRMIITGQKDIRLMTLNGYTRLVGYDTELNLVADVLESFEVEEERIFTFRLRAGHRWSDGVPVSTEDFRHAWEDVLNDPDLRPGGLPADLLAAGHGPTFEILDPLTLRYSWADPNPSFLPALAAPQPIALMLPAHYMKQFHPKYQTKVKLAALVAGARVQDWTDLYAMKSRSYRPENPDLPTLEPWRNVTAPPAEQFVFERNPYFHRVDETGRQLPYVDRFILNVSTAAIISAKAGAGETDLQMTALDFVDYPYLKSAEKIHPVKVDLWKRIQGSVVTLVPNLNCADSVWRGVMQDVRVRRALSLAMDRHEINMVSFFGLAQESADTVLPESPLFKPSYATQWAIHDPDRANRLLDEAGLDRRDGEGIRRLPDGRPMNIVVETSSRSSIETDVIQLVRDHWRKVGVALFIRATQRDIFRTRAMAGSIVMSAWGGIDNAVPTADMPPAELAPTGDDQLQWPLWGMHYYSRGMKGAAPDLPAAKRLLELYEKWRRSTGAEERRVIWDEMLQIRSDQVFTIGTVNATLQPIMRSSYLNNVPDKALYGFAPTSYLGVYLPDTFWYDEGRG